MKLGLIGEKLGHSWSGQIHERLLAWQKISGTYELIEVPRDQVMEIPKRMEAEGITGLNVTIPYKETLLAGLDGLSEEVKKIGALNTILYQNGKTCGYNTDYYGVLYMFQRAGVNLAGKKVTLLGAGGASKAAIYAIIKAGAAFVTVAARNIPKAEQTLKAHFPEIHIQGIDDLPPGDVLLNTTPVGMYPNTGSSVVGEQEIRKYQIVADMVYNPLKTEFLKLAEANGLKCVSGLAMLVGQAVRAEEIWFSTKIDPEVGEEILSMLTVQMEGR